MTDFAQVVHVRVPRSVIDATQLFLRQAGLTGREGMVLWVGKQSGDTFEVTTLLIPRQKGLKTHDGVCVVVDGDEMHRINVELFNSGLQLIAQVHSHPTDAYHSETDDAYALATSVGAFSLVVPDFATREFDLRDCAVYRLSETGQWEYVSPRRAKQLLLIGDS